MKNRIMKMLGIEYPIFQGGMAWVSTAKLVAAVSNAGGLGILGSGAMEPEMVRSEIKKIRQLTTKPFGINIMLMMQTASGVVDVCVEEKVPVVTTGAGNPGPYVQRFKEAGIKVIPVISSVALARRLERSGVDAVVAEGHESGGHVGEITTMALLPQVVDALNIPVIAAGGIGDGRGLLAAAAFGAEGFQMGTRFILAKECEAHQNYKEAIKKAKDRDTTMTGYTHGHPVRCIKNRLTREYITKEFSGASVEELDALGAGRLRAAVRAGDVDRGSVMAGQISGMISKEETAAEILQSLIEEYKQAYAHLAENYSPSRFLQ